MVFMGFVVLPVIEAVVGFEGYYPLYDDSPSKVFIKFVEYLFILPHVGAFFGSFVTAIPQLWSIGVEENFYFVWPQLFRRFYNRLPRFLLTFIGVKVAIIVIAWLILPVTFIPEVVKTFLDFINFIHVESMAVGALGGYLLFKHKDFVKQWLFHPVVEKGVLLIILANMTVFYAGEEMPLLRFFLSIVYLLFLMNACANEKFTFRLEHPLFNHLGRISYGIYMYHLLVLYLIMMALTVTGHPLTNSFGDNVLLYTLVTVGTVGVAHLSHLYFETPFLRLKQRFAVVASGQHEEEPVGSTEPTPVVVQS
jgi:peptidoglycan/LPS O-acetylase OafA/YrhL